MVKTFNYSIRADSTFCDTRVNKTLEGQAAFLRTVVCEHLPGIKSWDLFEKLMFGAEINKSEVETYHYLLERASDYCFFDSKTKRTVSLLTTISWAAHTSRQPLKVLLRRLLSFVHKDGFSTLQYIEIISHLCNIPILDFVSSWKNTEALIESRSELLFLGYRNDVVTDDMWFKEKKVTNIHDVSEREWVTIDKSCEEFLLHAFGFT